MSEPTAGTPHPTEEPEPLVRPVAGRLTPSASPPEAACSGSLPGMSVINGAECGQ
ncbi:hypothetical protein PJI17_24765 [Mycobacterium kansasii]